MSRQLQAALAVILLPIAFFLLWYFPGYEGAIGCMVVILLSILFLHSIGETTSSLTHAGRAGTRGRA